VVKILGTTGFVFSFLLVAAAQEAKVGCPALCDRDWAEGCTPNDTPPVSDFWAGPGVTDVTFLAFGDAQTSSGPANKNMLNARALNAADTVLSWTETSFGVNAPVGRVRGVIMAGDISNDGRDGRYMTEDNIAEFTDVYGLCGNAILKYPIFEGYGNHDYFTYDHLMYRLFLAHPVADSVSQRNPYRAGLVETAPGADGHYSWEWDNIHFVQLNLAPSDLVPAMNVAGARNPRQALRFLRQDLAKHVAGTNKRVVIVTHYGFYNSWDFDGWWTYSEANAYHDVIKYYDVIAHLHGHAHSTGFYHWRGIPVFNLGSPFYNAADSNPDGRGHFSVFRITDDFLYAGDAGWNPADPENDIVFPGKWYAKIPLHDRGVSQAIVCNPPPDRVRAGDRLELVAPEGSAFLWERNGEPLFDIPPRIAGVESRTLVINPVRESDSGLFTVGYDNGSGSKILVKSEPLLLRVQPGALPVSNLWTIAGLVLLLAVAGTCPRYTSH